MEVKIIRIGNSRGLCLNKTILDRYSIGDRVILKLMEDHIVIVPQAGTRAGWEDAFKRLHLKANEPLLIPDAFTDDDVLEWS